MKYRLLKEAALQELMQDDNTMVGTDEVDAPAIVRELAKWVLFSLNKRDEMDSPDVCRSAYHELINSQEPGWLVQHAQHLLDPKTNEGLRKILQGEVKIPRRSLEQFEDFVLGFAKAYIPNTAFPSHPFSTFPR